MLGPRSSLSCLVPNAASSHALVCLSLLCPTRVRSHSLTLALNRSPRSLAHSNFAHPAPSPTPLPRPPHLPHSPHSCPSGCAFLTPHPRARPHPPAALVQRAQPLRPVRRRGLGGRELALLRVQLPLHPPRRDTERHVDGAGEKIHQLLVVYTIQCREHMYTKAQVRYALHSIYYSVSRTYVHDGAGEIRTT